MLYRAVVKFQPRVPERLRTRFPETTICVGPLTPDKDRAETLRQFFSQQHPHAVAVIQEVRMAS